jgi:AraC-like DNA-binding protein
MGSEDDTPARGAPGGAPDVDVRDAPGGGAEVPAEAPEPALVLRPVLEMPGVELWTTFGAAGPMRMLPIHYGITAVDPRIVATAAADYRYRGAERTIAGAALGLFEPDEIFVVRRVSRPLEVHWFMFDPAVVAREVAERDGKGELPHFGESQLSGPDLYPQVQRAWALVRDAAADPLEREHAVRAVLGFALERGGERPPPPPASGCDRAVRRAVELLNDCYDRPLRLEDLARACGLSKYYLERSFTRRLGVPIYEYAQLVRASRALDRIRDGQRPTDVFKLAGYADQPHMTRAFRRLYGFTPGDYYRSRRGRPRS